MNLRLENVSFSFSSPVLRGISLEIPSTDFLSILGPNGCGKSTLLRLIGRILVPEKGTISLYGRPLESYTRRELAKIIAYVPQETAWLYPFTVLETVLMGRAPYLSMVGFEQSADLKAATEAMRMTDILHLAEQPVTGLSGGERQRVLIARALTQESKMLLLDEPNAHLDLSHQVELFLLLKKLQIESGLTVIAVSHDLNLVANVSTRILLLAPTHSGNSVYALGTPAEVLTPSILSHVFQTPVAVTHDSNVGSLNIHLPPETFILKQGTMS